MDVLCCVPDFYDIDLWILDKSSYQIVELWMVRFFNVICKLEHFLDILTKNIWISVS